MDATSQSELVGLVVLVRLVGITDRDGSYRSASQIECRWRFLLYYIYGRHCHAHSSRYAVFES